MEAFPEVFTATQNVSARHEIDVAPPPERFVHPCPSYVAKPVPLTAPQNVADGQETVVTPERPVAAGALQEVPLKRLKPPDASTEMHMDADAHDTPTSRPVKTGAGGLHDVPLKSSARPFWLTVAQKVADGHETDGGDVYGVESISAGADQPDAALADPGTAM